MVSFLWQGASQGSPNVKGQSFFESLCLVMLVTSANWLAVPMVSLRVQCKKSKRREKKTHLLITLFI